MLCGLNWRRALNSRLLTMNDLVIEGLTKRQRAIADVLWMINGREQVEQFLATLEADTRRDAEVVVEMMIASVMDSLDNTDEARRLLKEYML